MQIMQLKQGTWYESHLSICDHLLVCGNRIKLPFPMGILLQKINLIVSNTFAEGRLSMRNFFFFFGYQHDMTSSAFQMWQVGVAAALESFVSRCFYNHAFDFSDEFVVKRLRWWIPLKKEQKWLNIVERQVMTSIFNQLFAQHNRVPHMPANISNRRVNSKWLSGKILQLTLSMVFQIKLSIHRYLK